MIARFIHFISFLITTLFLVAIVGCAGAPSLRTVSKASESKRQYLGMKKVAVMPLNNIAGEKGAEDQALTMIVNELNIMGTFDEIEEPRYVGSVLKSLKLRQLSELDLETVQKMGSEMSAQALIFGDIHAWGLGEGDGAAMGVSLTLTMIDTQTGKVVWIGNGARRASFTMSRALGLDEGPTDLEVARDVVISLLRNMDRAIVGHREEELSRIKSEEAAKLKAAAEAEKRRLEEMMKEEE